MYIEFAPESNGEIDWKIAWLFFFSSGATTTTTAAGTATKVRFYTHSNTSNLPYNEKFKWKKKCRENL